MVYQQLVAFFGGLTRAAEALDVSKQTVDSWKRRRIPSGQQFKVHRLSSGKLKLDPQAKRDAKELALNLPVADPVIERRAA